MTAASNLQRGSARRRVRGQRGNALVEGALTLLLFLTIIIGLMEFGRYVWAFNEIAYAAREGARYAIVRGSTSSSPATATTVTQAVQAAAVGLDPNAMTVAVNWSPNNKPGSSVQVKVSYTLVPATSLIPPTSMTVGTTASMVVLQ